MRAAVPLPLPLRRTATLAVAGLLFGSLVAASGEPSTNYPLSAASSREWTSEGTRSQLLEALNAERLRHGLLPLRAQAELRNAAQGHADYLHRHAEVSHLQRNGKLGFTGVRPLQRARAAGYPVGAANEVAELFVVGLAQVEAALAQLLSGPYHRHFLLWASASEVGIGLSAQPGLVLSLGAPSPHPAPGPNALLWPAPGTLGVPPIACCERPRPAGLDEFGMPVSVQVPPGLRLRVTQFDLLDAEGQRVETRLLDTNSDEHLRLNPHVAYLLPMQALRPAHTYRAVLRASSAAGSIERDWQFTTAH